MYQKKPQSSLDQQLVLNQFICNELGYKDMRAMLKEFSNFTEELDSSYENDEYHPFINIVNLRQKCKIVKDDLLNYGCNIHSHSIRLRMGITHKYNWKPHQYIALLMMECYFDLWFKNKDDLCDRLNEFIRFNQSFSVLPEYHSEELSTVAIQSATGSGKTLIMHAHILQYQHYARYHGRRFNNIYLITPDAYMSNQHLRELQKNSIPSGVFDKSKTYLGAEQGYVHIIDIHKVADESKEVRVDVRELGINNLVLVDEGHLGQVKDGEGSAWRKRRMQLATDGFTIEYSATFNQIAKGNLLNHYSKCLLFDYSYRYFYKDGYGKNPKIANLQKGMRDENSQTWLIGCLLAFYQQLKIFDEYGYLWPDYRVERPLWVMLGHTVITRNGEITKESNSDIVTVIKFLDWVLSERQDVERKIQSIFDRESDIDDVWFYNRISHLQSFNQTVSELYDDLCGRLFHGKGQLHLTYLTQGEGELHLTSVEGGDVFGVINVGAPEKVYALVKDDTSLNIPVHRNTGFAKRLFSNVDTSDSPVRLLIGAKKFVAGWNSWRVSTMTLLNVGQGQGAQIIQMFGRGVRLKGLYYSLKRHNCLSSPAPENSAFLSCLETLNIYGLKAKYMETFQKLLEEEGIDTFDDSFTVPVCVNLPINLTLPMLTTKKDRIYQKHGEVITVDVTRRKQNITLDLYSKIQTLEENLSFNGKKIQKFQSGEHALFDKSRIYYAILHHKQVKHMHNLKLPYDFVSEILQDDSWYSIFSPSELVINSVEDVKRHESYFIRLACKLVDECWYNGNWGFEQKNKEIVSLDASNPSIIKNYELSFSRDYLSTDNYDYKVLIENSEFSKEIEFSQLGIKTTSPCFHVYMPIIYKYGENDVMVSPVPLNWGEYETIEQLKKLVGKSPIENYKLYLLRNAAKAGTSFLSNPAYYPDFICWLIGKDIIHMIFIDPKSTIYTKSSSPKFRLHSEISKISDSLGDKSLKLHSYILSVSDDEESSNPQNGMFKLRDNPQCLAQMFEHVLQY